MNWFLEFYESAIQMQEENLVVTFKNLHNHTQNNIHQEYVSVTLLKSVFVLSSTWLSRFFFEILFLEVDDAGLRSKISCFLKYKI